ncbi:MAG: type III secretion system export apparatus subunit SctR [Polyangia bacterium]|nr:type III secretion system export apparatus subunit SctR [Polyangia bacterium]
MPRSAAQSARLASLAPLPLCLPLPALAPAADRLLDSPAVSVLLLAALSLASFGLVMLTSFVKVAVVLSVLRSAMGTPQIPPTMVITGFALVLSAYIMSPVIREGARRAEPGVARLQEGRGTSTEQASELIAVGRQAAEPLRDFLAKHAHARDRQTFLEMARRLSGPKDKSRIGPADFQVLIPAFLTSELKEAFLIGFFLFVPFLVIDLVVANILLALGMHMLSPTTISLPFKFLLFVLADGWYLLTRGLVAGYQ